MTKQERNAKARAKQYSTKEGHARLIFSGVKSRAKKEGLIFNLEVDDVLTNLPYYCPALCIKLSWCKRKGQAGDKDTSPSLDKFYPEQGYVPGNVFWVSGLANKIKSKFSTAEISAVANWMNKINA